jgi:hypothetical protein
MQDGGKGRAVMPTSAMAAAVRGRPCASARDPRVRPVRIDVA